MPLHWVCGSHCSCHCCSSPSLTALPCLRGAGCSPQGCRLRLPHLTPQPAEYVRRAGERAAACTTMGCQCASEADSAQVPAVVVMARNAAFFSVTTNGIQMTTVCKSGTWRMTARERRCQRTQAESTAGAIHPQAWGKELRCSQIPQARGGSGQGSGGRAGLRQLTPLPATPVPLPPYKKNSMEPRWTDQGMRGVSRQ